MKRLLLPICLLIAQLSSAQISIDTLAWNDFENVPQPPAWNYTATPAPTWNGGYSTGTAAPPNSPLGIGASRAWETTTVSGGVLLEFANTVIPPGYDSIRVHFHLAAMNLQGSSGGPDDLDYVLNAYSIDGGTTWINRLRVRGAIANNSFWAYDATGFAQSYYTPATETVFQPSTTGLQTTFGYSNVEIVFPGSVTQIAFRITARSSSSTDTWLVDNLTLTGETQCSPSASTISPSVCTSYLSPSGNSTWTTSGTYMDTIPNFIGCDSVITVNLTVLGTSTGTLTATACDSYLSPSGNQTWIATGIYSDTILNIAGCDSIITADITIHNSTASTISPSACDSYLSPGGSTYTTSGTYTEVLTNTAGCDSTITIQLTINTASATVTQSGNTLTANVSDTYQWVDCGNNFSAISGATSQSFTPTVTGNYAVVITTLAGCTDTSSCTQVTVVGLAENLNGPELAIFPNPVTSKLEFTLQEGNTPTPFAIFDCLGREVANGIALAKRNVVDFGSMPEGVYYLRIASGATIRFSKIH